MLRLIWSKDGAKIRATAVLIYLCTAGIVVIVIMAYHHPVAVPIAVVSTIAVFALLLVSADRIGAILNFALCKITPARYKC